MTGDVFRKYLINLGFTDDELSSFLCRNIFRYSPKSNIPEIKYILVENDEEIFQNHLQLWNRNSDHVFIAVGKDKTFIIDCKKKPQKGIIQNIDTFNYGVNSEGFEDVNIDLISKNYIDSSYFFQFIQQKQRKKQEVDKDLLLNLIALRNDLLENGNEQLVHLIILRCLFVKYLEDRGIFTFNYLSEILASKSVNRLIDAFGEVCKINGDVFGGSRLKVEDIKVDYLDKLHLFFSADYQSGQGTLFPYQFDNIPIQLISHVYEAFLNDNTKKGKGVYYTPSFVVNFMLSQSLKQKAEENPYLTVFDPAVGSAAFLVESFKIIRDVQARKLDKDKLSYEEKKLILQKQLWGVDVDIDALQISAFSLYLALLEDESPEFIRNKIESSHPILPSLIGSTLMHANTIIDPIFEEKKFDFIISNPPWGSVPTDGSKEHIAEREALDNRSGLYPEYKNVADYERSQAFLRRIERWQKPDTIIVMIVKNSIFLNDKVADFRTEFLSKNKLETFYELSNYNKILFKKKVFKSEKVKIEIGASEPCAIAIFKPNADNSDYKINYIAPKLTKLGEHFEIIQYTSNESFFINRSKFIENDILWRILVNSDLEGYNLINNISINSDLLIEVRAGFQPKQNMVPIGKPLLRNIIEPIDFEAYYQKNQNLNQFNWNQELHRRRDEDIYLGSKILIPVRPLKDDNLKLRGIHLNKEVVYKHNILSIKIKNENGYNDNYPYLSLINSKLIGFYIFNISSQWGKGSEKRATLRNVDLETLPIKKITNNKTRSLFTNKINNYIQEKENGRDGTSILNELDEEVYKFYELTGYEKEIINEFYQVNVERASDKLKFVQPRDIQTYFETFKESFELILSANHTLNASYSISSNIGAIIKITIVEKSSGKELEHDNSMQVLQFVKNKQLNETDKLLKEEKVKLYEPTHFYLIKSNQFKDWTKRQAFKDAKEEIELLFSNLPDTHE
jgi:Type I restriction-modification system methyltransferase subunit